MRTELVTLKGHSSLVTSIIFSNDKKILITGSKDGKIGLWNVKENFKLITMLKMTDLGLNEEEINAICYYSIKDGNNHHPFLIIGGLNGTLSVFNLNKS